ncbi:DUF4190 domain-containing protein [Sinomonas cellulolyticus]|uniref:DUF4190 domain-containing protein n=1 Tax=Sinomonas cellulolyticus TaxID=2801916 RepID=UPI001E4BECEF|nr:MULTISPECIES: DUF4190 domain-containing protein [Sinomonas]
MPKPSETDGAPERPRYSPPSYVPPVSLGKGRDNPTEPLPPGPMSPGATQPLPPGTPPRAPEQRPRPDGAPREDDRQGQDASRGSGLGSVPYGQTQASYGQPPYGQGQPPYGQFPYGQNQQYGQPPYGPAAQYGQGYPPYPYGAPEPRGLSIAAMVCGISVFVGFGFFVLPQIAAVVLGHMALSREPAGRGMALAGLVMGYVGLALTIAFIALFVVVLGIAPTTGRYSSL